MQEHLQEIRDALLDSFLALNRKVVEKGLSAGCTGTVLLVVGNSSNNHVLSYSHLLTTVQEADGSCQPDGVSSYHYPVEVLVALMPMQL